MHYIDNPPTVVVFAICYILRPMNNIGERGGSLYLKLVFSSLFSPVFWQHQARIEVSVPGN